MASSRRSRWAVRCVTIAAAVAIVAGTSCESAGAWSVFGASPPFLVDSRELYGVDVLVATSRPGPVCLWVGGPNRVLSTCRTRANDDPRTPGWIRLTSPCLDQGNACTAEPLVFVVHASVGDYCKESERSCDTPKDAFARVLDVRFLSPPGGSRAEQEVPTATLAEGQRALYVIVVDAGRRVVVRAEPHGPVEATVRELPGHPGYAPSDGVTAIARLSYYSLELRRSGSNGSNGSNGPALAPAGPGPHAPDAAGADAGAGDAGDSGESDCASAEASAPPAPVEVGALVSVETEPPCPDALFCRVRIASIEGPFDPDALGLP